MLKVIGNQVIGNQGIEKCYPRWYLVANTDPETAGVPTKGHP